MTGVAGSHPVQNGLSVAGEPLWSPPCDETR